MRSFSGESDADLKNAPLHVTVVWQQGRLPRMGRFWIFFLGMFCYLEYICLHLPVSDFVVVKIVCVVTGTGEPEVHEGRL